MYNKIDLKLKQVYLEKNGLKRDGFLKKILLVASSGIADLQTADAFLISIKFKLKDEKLLETDMYLP